MDTSFISQNTLNTLLARVCDAIPYLSLQINSATPLWDDPIEWCKQIEDNLTTVDTVILNVRKIRGRFNAYDTNSPLLNQAVLSRVYILLYLETFP